MTLDEFQEKYCVLCGTQRCGGVYDEEFREGCQHYKEEYNLKSEENTEEHTCYNCEHFGGCCCDNVDEDGKCLGWEKYIPMMSDEEYDKLIHKAADIVRGLIAKGELPNTIFR